MTGENTSYYTDTYPKSFWLSQKLPSYPELTENAQTEVGVIGGGIVGIMTAYLLAKAGTSVTLLEAKDFLHGVTGHTTAKITAQHGLVYDELIQIFGKEKARQYYDANLLGSGLIQETMQTLAIDCDFERKDAVVFASSDKAVKKIKAEARAYQTLGIQGTLAYGNVDELPFPVDATLTMPDQAQFHPVKFLSPLLQEIERLGGEIYEHSRAVRVKVNSTVVLENGAQLMCDKLIIASHYPFNDFTGLYFTKLDISRSYALAAKVTGPIPQAMYLSADSPSRSLRSIKVENGEEWLLIGGNDHPTGKSEMPTQSRYHNLEAFGRMWYGLYEVPYHWSAQDMATLDKMPYIGQMTDSSPDVFVATGFDKWGMAIGAFASRLLSDLVLGHSNGYAELFKPTRSKMKSKDIRQFVKKNTTVAKDFVVTKTQRAAVKPENLQMDEGGLVEVDGHKAGAYRDEEGHLHLVKPTCTHLGCGLRWNDAERTWDCACHGSRFSYKGDVINGPAVEPLEKLDTDD